jgi:NADPH:quinone reductase-like Zn-dependent oxidoreductase
MGTSQSIRMPSLVSLRLSTCSPPLFPLDGSAPDWQEILQGSIDVAVDLVGSAETLSRSFATLARGGRLALLTASLQETPDVLRAVEKDELFARGALVLP